MTTKRNTTKKKYAWMYAGSVDVNLCDTEQEAIDGYTEWLEDNYEPCDDAYICEVVPIKRVTFVKQIKLENI